MPALEVLVLFVLIFPLPDDWVRYFDRNFPLDDDVELVTVFSIPNYLLAWEVPLECEGRGDIPQLVLLIFEELDVADNVHDLLRFFWRPLGMHPFQDLLKPLTLANRQQIFRLLLTEVLNQFHFSIVWHPLENRHHFSKLFSGLFLQFRLLL